jgi:hypothetical protein
MVYVRFKPTHWADRSVECFCLVLTAETWEVYSWLAPHSSLVWIEYQLEKQACDLHLAISWQAWPLFLFAYAVFLIDQTAMG